MDEKESCGSEFASRCCILEKVNRFLLYVAQQVALNNAEEVFSCPKTMLQRQIPVLIYTPGHQALEGCHPANQRLQGDGNGSHADCPKCRSDNLCRHSNSVG